MHKSLLNAIFFIVFQKKKRTEAIKEMERKMVNLSRNLEHVFQTIIRGEPERAPNTRVTFGEFAVPMYLSIYPSMYMYNVVHVLIAHAQYAYALHHHDERLCAHAQISRVRS